MMKRSIYFLISVLILTTVIMSRSPSADADNTEILWDIVEQYSPNDFITAAIVTQAHFESNCLPNAVGGGYLISKDYDAKVTAAIDEGLADGSAREAFCKHVIGKYQCWGYGLIQWVDSNELGKLYDFAQSEGTSISDADMQVRFILWNTETNFPDVWQKLLDAETAADAGRVFAHWIGGTELAEKLEDRAWMAEELYKEHKR